MKYICMKKPWSWSLRSPRSHSDSDEDPDIWNWKLHITDDNNIVWYNAVIRIRPFEPCFGLTSLRRRRSWSVPPAITLLKLNRRVLYTKMHANGGGGGAVIGGIDRLDLDRHFSDPAASLSSSLVRNDTTDTISEDDDATEASFGCPLSGANNHGTIRTAGWIRHTTSSYIKNKTQSSRKRPRYFVLRGNTISY